jgi:hypothetical protein
MKLGIVGCLDFADYEKLCSEVDSFLEEIGEPCLAVVSGGAKGADTLGRKYAEEHGLEMIEHLPEWKKYGRAAGPIRNKLIVDDADAVIAFWDNQDKGTQSTINLTKKSSKRIKIVEI